MGRNAHDRPGTVGGENVVADIDRDALAVQPVNRVATGEHAGLFFVRGQAVDLRGLAGLVDVLFNGLTVFFGGQPRDQGMLGG